MSSESATYEPLLEDTEERYVMFPIKDSEIWEMYKKQVDCFWRAEEIDLSKDIFHWEQLNNDERHFISMILAFFAASDGIVLENLSTRFLNDVQLAEARAFYAFQGAMENIHCVTSDTKILTNSGYTEIGTLVDQQVDIWNGNEFTEVTVKYTGDQNIYGVRLSNGMYLKCSPGHKWLIGPNKNQVETVDIEVGDIISEYQLPKLSLNQLLSIDELNGLNEYKKIEVLINESLQSPLVALPCEPVVKLGSSSLEELQSIQLTLTLFGVLSSIYSVEPLNQYDKPTTHYLILYYEDLKMLEDSGFKFVTNGSIQLEHISRKPNVNIFIVSIDFIDYLPTYCFNEPKLGHGIFNGILTCQSETYSLLIDTYIKEPNKKNELLNSLAHYPCIQRKAKWAQRWIGDTNSSFASRLVAFACIEGIFFSGAFCSIFWIKQKKIMPGLTFSNELISRDEALHCEFAVLLYKRLRNKLSVEEFVMIVKDSVEIELDFICNALPCRLLGMNSDMMSEYIKFVADRLAVQMGYPKIYHSTNPFPWMESISVERKTNFFEARVAEYALASGTVTNATFENLDEDF